MPRASAFLLRADEIAIVGFTFLLIALSLVVGTPLLEPFGMGRLTTYSVYVLPLLVVLLALLRRGGVGRFVSLWWPLFGVVAVYESLKHLHANRITAWLGIAPKDALMLRIDELLFGKALPLWFDGWTHPAVIELMLFFYIWVYYLAPVVSLAYAYFVRNDLILFYRVRNAIVFGLLGGYVFYILVPVAGPLFLIGEQFTEPIPSQRVVQRLVFDTLRYNYDCFPSLHTAIPWLLTAVLWSSLSRSLRGLAIFFASGVTLSTVVLRYHYGIDLIAAGVWVVIVLAVVRRIPIRVPEERVVMPVLSAPTPLHHRQLRILGILFTVTGFVALVAEQAFEKLLSTLLGASTPAAAAVLSVYFAGFTIGSLAYAHVRRRVRNPMKVYAIAEGLVAVWILLLAVFLPRLTFLFAPLLALGRDNFLLLQLLRLLTAAVWILPPTFMMGVSFPSVTDALQQIGAAEKGRSVTLFYALNLVGAIAAALIAPYVLFPALGLGGAMLLGAAADLAVCLVALKLAAQVEAPSEPAAPAVDAPEREPAASRREVAPLLGIAALSGFIFFAVEILWTHLLSTVLGNSVYAFATMLAVVLLGLGLGAAIVAIYRIDQIRSARAIGALLIGGSFAMLLTHGLWPEVPHWLAVHGRGVRGFLGAEMLRFRYALLLILTPATILGMVFPSIFRLPLFEREGNGRVVGMLYAANCLGCLTGALLAGFWMIPAFGSETSLRILIIISALTGTAFFLASSSMAQRLFALGCAVLFLLLFRLPLWDPLSLTSGEHVYFRRTHVFSQTRLRFFHEDTNGGITTVVDNPKGTRGVNRPYRTLLTNGKFQGNDSFEMAAQTAFALIPNLFVKRYEDALVIGAGTAKSAEVVHSVGFRRVDVAEIAEGIVIAARTFFSHINRKVLDQPNVNVFLEDGRNVLLLRDKKYDLISIEVSSVWFAGATNIYSREFYELAERRLHRDGVLQQWVQLHHIGTEELKTAIATVRAVFPFVSVWFHGGQGIVVASNVPQTVTRESLARTLRVRGPENQPLTRSDINAILESRILAPEDVTRMVENEIVPLNTDMNRRLEYHTPKYNIARADMLRMNIAELRRLAGVVTVNRPAPRTGGAPPRVEKP